MTGLSEDPSAVSLGVRTHSAHGQDDGGWATYVVLGGRLSDPRILRRGRMELSDADVEGSNQPFHRAGSTYPFDRADPMDFETGEAFIARCRKYTQDLADGALAEIISTYGAPRACCVLTGPERPLPPLRAILASHALMHAAEREFWREAVRNAAERRGIATAMLTEKDLPSLTERLPGTEATRRDALKAFGKQVGSPWAQDEKFAATAAWFGLTLRSL